MPAEVERLRRAYDSWFADVSSTRGYAAQRIYLGAPQQPLVTLTRQDWRGPAAGWTPKSVGHWEVEVTQAGNYDIEVRLAPIANAATLTLKLQDQQLERQLPATTQSYKFDAVPLSAGPGQLEVSIAHVGGVAGATYVDVAPTRVE
jgi:hypothetical protein